MGALAVAGDLLGQIERHLVQGRLERVERDRAGGPRRHDHRRITRRRVGVDAHAVERPIDHTPEGGVEVGRREFGIGEQQRDVRRHVGLDHADTLGHADDTGIAGRNGGLGELGHRVRGHHPAGRAIGVVGCQFARQCCDPGADPIDRIATTDDTRRRDDHVGGFAPEAGSDRTGDLERVVVALPTSRHVRVLGDHDHRPRRSIGDVGPAQRDAGSGEPTLGEHRSGGDGHVGGDHHEVVGVVLDPDVCDVAAETPRQDGHSDNPALIAAKIDAMASTWLSSRWSKMWRRTLST